MYVLPGTWPRDVAARYWIFIVIAFGRLASPLLTGCAQKCMRSGTQPRSDSCVEALHFGVEWNWSTVVTALASRLRS